MGYKAYFLSIECVIDVFVTAIDIICLIMEFTDSGISEPEFKIILLLRLVRIARVVFVRLRRLEREQQNELDTKVFLRPDVNDFFRDRAEDVENETTVMLTRPKLMGKYANKVDARYSPRGKGDLVFQVKNLQVKLLTRVQNLSAEYHVLQLFNNMKRLIEPDGAELDHDEVEKMYKELTKLFETSWREYSYKSARDVQVAASLDQNAENLGNLQNYLLDLVLFTDKRLVESSLHLLLLSSRTKKHLVYLAKTTNLLVGSELCDKYFAIRDLRLECQTVMDSFENWGFIKRGEESAFLEKINFLDLKFHRMAQLNSLEGTELQVALIDEGIIDLLRDIIDIPNMYRGIGYTKFYENNQDSFYISADIKKQPDEYVRLLKNIELNMLGLFRSLNLMLLSLLGRRKSERDKRVQAKIFGLINDLLPWVGTVELADQVIIQAVSGNRDLCNAIDDKFIRECAMQFNDRDNPKLPKKNPIAIMLVISKISYQPEFLLPRNQKRLVAELCRTKQMEKFLTDQVELTYHAPQSVGSKWIAQREELLHMVAHLCVGEINITEAKMLELVDFGSVLSAVLADNGKIWKTSLCFLDLFYHMVVDAELKIGALGQHPNLAKLLTLFSNQLCVLCGWFEGSNYPQFKPGELLQLLNETPDIFDGDIFQPYHPSYVSGTRSIGDASDPIVLIRYSVFFIARMCKRLFSRYGEDLANLNSKAIRDITYCAEVLRNTFEPKKFDASKVVGKAVLKFCLAMEELHVETKFITSGYRGGTYESKFEAVLEQHENGYQPEDFDIFCIPRPLWRTYWKD
jgi:hypothetical protein